MFCTVVSGSTGFTYQLIGGLDNTDWIEFVSSDNKLDINLRNLVGLDTSGTTVGNGGKCCNTTLPQNIEGSLVQVFVNGVLVPCGDSSGDYCFFAPDDGTETDYSNARAQGDQQENDYLYWKENADYQVDSDDLFDFVLLV
jgi:hypothetical protein